MSHLNRVCVTGTDQKTKQAMSEKYSPISSILGSARVQDRDGGWATDAERLMLMDRKDFNLLGIGLDDLIEGYIQTILSVIAIDRLAVQLIGQKGKLRKRLFRSLNDDPALLSELHSEAPAER